MKEILLLPFFFSCLPQIQSFFHFKIHQASYFSLIIICSVFFLTISLKCLTYFHHSLGSLEWAVFWIKKIEMLYSVRQRCFQSCFSHSYSVTENLQFMGHICDPVKLGNCISARVLPPCQRQILPVIRAWKEWLISAERRKSFFSARPMSSLL